MANYLTSNSIYPPGVARPSAIDIVSFFKRGIIVTYLIALFTPKKAFALVFRTAKLDLALVQLSTGNQHNFVLRTEDTLLLYKAFPNVNQIGVLLLYIFIKFHFVDSSLHLTKRVYKQF